MRGGVTRVTQALAVVLLAGAGTAHAQYALSLYPELRVVEGNAGTVALLFTVQISAPSPVGASVTWATVPGSALAGSDFVSGTDTVNFGPGDGSPKNVTVLVQGDTLDEWDTTLTDETFFVVLSNPVGATIDKGRATATILDDDHPSVNQRPGVQFLSAVSGSVVPHGPNDGQVRLQWRIPAAQVQPDNVVIRENVGALCSFPLADTDGAPVASMGTTPAAGMTQFFTHSNLALDSVHCYSVFAVYPGGTTTEIAQIKGTPFNAGGTIAWKYASNATSLVPPTVGLDAIYTTDSNGVVHAMARGTGGGVWPSTWNPVSLGKPTQNRSAVVPLPAGWRLFLGTDGGGVHSIDGRTGNVVWSLSTTAGTALPNLGAAQAQPAGLFKSFGGNNDMLLVGTNAGVASNAFYALNPATGETLASLPDPDMGNVLGMAVVDYPGNRVFFLSSTTTETLYAMDLGPMGAPSLSMSSVAWNPRPGAGSNGSTVMRNNRLYYGDNANQLVALHIDGTSYATGTGDGAVKGFVWPDRRSGNDNVYFATTGNVHAVRDTGSGFAAFWATPISVTSPSMVLQKPGTDFLYIGDGDGNLVQINIATQAQVSLRLEGPGVQIGAPSLDGTHNLVMVGSVSGTIYAVRAPF